MKTLQTAFISLIFSPFILGIGSVTVGQVGSVNGTLTNKVTAARSNYTVTIQTAKSIYEPDERIVLIVTARNTGATVLNYLGTAGPIYGNLRVLANGKPCPLTLYGKYTIQNQFTWGRGIHGLPAGGEWRDVYHLNRGFDMTMDGDYTIYLKLEGVEADPITIRIRDNGLKFN